MHVIPHSRPTLCEDDAQAVSMAVASGQLSSAGTVSAFEAAMANYVEQPYACAVSSGTAGLHLALLALGVKKGDEVIIPTHACTALLNAVQYTGAVPKIVDVAYDDANICSAEARKKLSRKTRAIIVPHMYGEPADLSSLLKIGVPVIEDCAQALGARYQGRPVGSFGVMGVFSFYATKMMTTGEGGMVVTGDRRLMDRVKDLCSYDHKPAYDVRYNYKMTEMEAALGLSQLKKFTDFLRIRRMIARFYSRVFCRLDVKLPQQSLMTDPVWYRYVVRSSRPAKKIIAALKERGVMAESPLFRPIHQYLKIKGCPVSDRLTRECVSVPIYPSMSSNDIRLVAREFLNVFDKQ